MKELLLIFMSTFFVPSIIYLIKYFIQKIKDKKINEYLDSEWMIDNAFKLNKLVIDFNKNIESIKDKDSLLDIYKNIIYNYECVFEYFFYCNKCDCKFSISSFINFIEINNFIPFSFKKENKKWKLIFEQNDYESIFHQYLINDLKIENNANINKPIYYSHDIYELIFKLDILKLYIFGIATILGITAISFSYYTFQYLSFYYYNFDLKNTVSLVSFLLSSIILIITVFNSLYMYITKKVYINKFYWEKTRYSYGRDWYELFNPITWIIFILNIFLKAFFYLFIIENYYENIKLSGLYYKTIDKYRLYKKCKIKDKIKNLKKFNIVNNKRINYMNMIYLKKFNCL